MVSGAVGRVGWRGSLALLGGGGVGGVVGGAGRLGLLGRGAGALAGAGGFGLLRGHVLDELGVGTGLAVEDGLVQRDLLVSDLALLGGRLLDLFGFLHDRQEFHARKRLKLLLTVAVLGFVELAFDNVEHLADLGEGLVWSEIWHQETLPARGDVISVGDAVLVLLSQSILLSFT